MIYSRLYLSMFLLSLTNIPASRGEGTLPRSTIGSLLNYHHKVFTSAFQEENRKKIFLQNVREVEDHNQLYEEGLTSYTLELNSFADQNPKVFAKTHNGYKRRHNVTEEVEEVFTNADVPSSFDWTKKGAVSPVKDQGGCGCCYAFAAVAAIESQVKLKGGSFQSLSEEQIVDCDKSNGGCGGGDQVMAMRYVQTKGGLQSDSTYPYTAGRNGNKGKCRFDRSKVVTKISGSKVASRSEEAMKTALINVGPLAISMYANDDFQSYSGGIYSCNSNRVNHAVLLVGYGTDNGQDYWLIKNSYGAAWGLKGFAKISRSQGKDCGVLVEGASYPKL